MNTRKPKWNTEIDAKDGLKDSWILVMSQCLFSTLQSCLVSLFNDFHCYQTAGANFTDDEVENMIEEGNFSVFTQSVSGMA